VAGGLLGRGNAAHRRALSGADARQLDRLATLAVPVLVLYGEYDIFSTSTHVVRDRFPTATQITLSGSGHLHWLQQPDGYRRVLNDFYAAALQPV
jgi:pimeloyl-ACP methyl ester carboxylesterase